MKKLISLFILLTLTSCGIKSEVTRKLNTEGFEVYNVTNVEFYEKALNKYYNNSVHLKDVVVYSTNDVTNLHRECQNDKQNYACSYASLGTMFFKDQYVYSCVVLMHEYAHIALAQITGDSDGGHEDEIFINNNKAIKELCNE